MKCAVIYARYSSDSQTEQSIEGQLRVCNEYAKANDILIVATYIDRAMTGKNDNRPDFQKMLRDCKRREWQYVLVYKLDRFSRNKYETAIHKKTLKDNGVKVISATEFVPDTPEGIILESMLEGYAEYYSAELSQKINRGLRESRMKGQFCGGGVPFGYKVQDKKLVIDKGNAKIVNYIYQRYAAGIIVPQIITELNEKGVLHCGKPFRAGNIYKILANEKYTGIYRAKDGEVYDKMYPRILDQELFERVKRIADRNKNNHRSTEIVYLLKNKLKCGYCGSSVTAETGTSKSGRVLCYYKCAGKKRHVAQCHLETIRKDNVENAVLNHIFNSLSSKEVMSKIVNALEKIQNEQAKELSELKMLKDQKNKVDLALNNVMAAIERGIITNTTNKRMRELEKEQEELERKIIIEQARSTVFVPRELIEEYYKKALRLEPQLLINYLVKEVRLYNDYIEIIYNVPIEKVPDESRGLLLYTDTTTITVYDTIVGRFYEKPMTVSSRI